MPVKTAPQFRRCEAIKAGGRSSHRRGENALRIELCAFRGSPRPSPPKRRHSPPKRPDFARDPVTGGDLFPFDEKREKMLAAAGTRIGPWERADRARGNFCKPRIGPHPSPPDRLGDFYRIALANGVRVSRSIRGLSRRPLMRQDNPTFQPVTGLPGVSRWRGAAVGLLRGKAGFQCRKIPPKFPTQFLHSF